MADAEDLKSSGDFSSCGFDSHPGHQFFRFSRLLCVPRDLSVASISMFPTDCAQFYAHLREKTRD